MAKPHSLCRRAQGSSPAAVPRACRTDPSPSPSYWPSSWGSLGTPWRVRAGARGTGDVPRPHGPQGSGVQELQPPAARKEGRTKREAIPYSLLYIVWPKIVCVVAACRKVFPSITLCCLVAGATAHMQFWVLPDPSPIFRGCSLPHCSWGPCSPLPSDLPNSPIILLP